MLPRVSISDGADTKKVGYGYLRIVKGRIRVGSDSKYEKSESDTEKVEYFCRISDSKKMKDFCIILGKNQLLMELIYNACICLPFFIQNKIK